MIYLYEEIAINWVGLQLTIIFIIEWSENYLLDSFLGKKKSEKMFITVS